jgi:hypothetical protein
MHGAIVARFWRAARREPGLDFAESLVSSVERIMADLLFIGITIGFFAVAWAYALACDRL